MFKVHTVNVHQDHSRNFQRQPSDTTMNSYRKSSRKPLVLAEYSLSNLGIPMSTNSLILRFKLFCRMSTSDKSNDSIDGSLKYPVKHKYSAQVSVHVHPQVVNKSKEEVRHVNSDLKSSDSVEQDLGENLILLDQTGNENIEEQPSLQCVQECDQICQDRGRGTSKSEFTDVTDNPNGCEPHSISENPYDLEFRKFNLSEVDANDKDFPQAVVDENKRNKFSLTEEIRYQTTFKRELQTVKVMTIVVGCFLFCFLPFLLVHLGEIICTCIFPEILHVPLSWLLYLNSCCNPFIYAFRNKPYADAFRRLLDTENCCGKMRLVTC
uniref:G_PROTEIN_RECEP_F1_2 domain-containing protein n=1 Tax=Schistosoma mansoni TaxID=6183 RepID=A0A5K4FBQ9_SCHMA